MTLKNERCIISVVVPVFNTAEYLHQLMECILYQTLPIEKIQVILVNDGSTDKSGSVCKEYSEKYEQIRYLELEENHGVSYARNLGMCYAAGKYITFMDSDDLWSLNAFETAAAFLDKHSAVVDAVNANIEFFERKSGKHYLWFDAPDDYIVDMYTEYQKIGSHCSTFIIKTEVAKQYLFDEKQRCWEDTKYMNQLLLRKKKFGWLSGVTYYYRIRNNADSATDSYGMNKAYYFDQLTRFVDDIYRTSYEECGEFMPMMQYLTAYALAFRFAEKIEILEEWELKKYYEILRRLLKMIDDKYILECCNADRYLKMQMLAFKRDLDISELIQTIRQQDVLLSGQNNQIARTKKNYDLLKRWILLKKQGKTLVPYFEQFHWEQIVVYGISDLGRYLCEELDGTSVTVLYAIDKRADRLNAGVPIYDLDAVLPDADVIVVTAVHFFEQIVKDLQGKVHCPIVSLEDIIGAME